MIAQCRILKAALHKVGSNIVTYVMNPKAMPRHHLLGHIDMDTRESFDGVLTYSSRQVGAAFALVLICIHCVDDRLLFLSPADPNTCSTFAPAICSCLACLPYVGREGAAGDDVVDYLRWRH